MKTIFNKSIVFITVISTIAFASCNETNKNLNLELTIQKKVELLESSKWLLKDFEDRVMYTFANGNRFTFYGTDNVFSEKAIPGTIDYTIIDNLLMLDFHFGNTKKYEIKFSCDNNIVSFYVEEKLSSTLYKSKSNYKQCL